MTEGANMFGKKSIKGKVLLPLISALIVSFVALIVIISVLNSKSVEKNTIAQSNATIESTALTINSYFGQYKKGIELLATNENLQKASKASIDTKKLQVDNLYNALLPYSSTYDGVLSTYIGLEDGSTVIAPENNVPEDYDPRKRPWYIETKAAQKAVWSEPYVDAFTGEMVITVSKPIYDESNQLLGVVGTDISLAYLIETIGAMNPGFDGHVILASATGAAIVHKDMQDKNLFEQPEYKFLAELADDDYAQHSKEIGNQLFVYQKIEGLNWIVGSIFEQKKIFALATATTNILIVTAIIVLVMMTAFILYLVSRITKPIEQLEQSAHQIASGDLTIELQTTQKDEIGRLTNAFSDMINQTGKTLQSVHTTVHQLSAASENLSAYAEQMNATSDQIAIATTSITDDAITVSDEASKINELSEQLTNQMVTIQQNADVLATSAQQANSINEAGLVQIDQLNQTNHSMQGRLSHMEEIMQSLEKGMYTIDEITTLITNISSQTNLLALNASIEAARAGEHGKGFAVVAEEVRKLAEQSAQASANVQQSIQAILQNTKTATSEMKVTNDHFTEQLEVMDKTSSAFHELSKLVLDMQKAIQTIYDEVTVATSDTQTMQQQMNSILLASQQTVAAAEQVAASTQEQSQASHTVATASEELLQMGHKMKELIDQFKLKD